MRNQISASNFPGPSASYFYNRQHRERVQNEVLQSDPELQQRVREEEYQLEDSDVFDGHSEMFRRATRLLNAAFAELPAAEKAEYEQQALDNKHDAWRKFRQEGRFVENEESLAQKADDERRGITGPLGGKGRGKTGVPSSSMKHQVTGTFIGGELLTPVQELTPPFDRNTLKMKTGKIEPEEYF